MTKISNQYSLTNVLFADAVNGRVGIGTTSPLTNLMVGDGAVTQQPYISLARTATGGYWAGIRWYDGTTVKSYIQEDSDYMLRFGTANTLRMVINASGNVGIGTSSPGGVLDVIGTNIFLGATSKIILSYDLGTSTNSNSPELAFYGQSFAASTSVYGPSIQAINQASFARKDLVFYQHNASDFTTKSEAMRLTYAGNLGIGTTTPGSKLQIGTMASYTGGGYTFAMSNGSTDFLITVNAAQTGSSVTFYSSTDYYFNRSGPSSTGIINAFGFNNVSDYRLKYDLESFDGLSLISQIKTYKYKMEETHETQYGVLAHEIQEVLPHLVVGVKDGDRMQSVDYQKIVPMLIKSVQEQQLQINELKALLNAH